MIASSPSPSATPPPRHTARWAPYVAIILTLGILAVTILVTRQQLRDRVREQIVARDGVVLDAVTSLPREDSDESDGGASSIEDPTTQLTLLLRTSRLRGVLAARLFDRNGEFVQAFPINARDGALSPDDLPALRAFQPVSRFHPDVPLSEVIWIIDPATRAKTGHSAILEVNVPLHDRNNSPLAGVAQFLIEGQEMAAEFERLEQHLNTQSLLAFAASGSIVTLIIGLAFRRLRQSHRLLEQRTNDLIDANRDLVQAAKTSAVGAVTSHLIHELKNPLAGLHGFVSASAAGAPHPPQEQWQEALNATRRMQTTVQEIITLLREEQSSVEYRVQISELAELVMHRLREPSLAKSIRLVPALNASGELSNRVVNLVSLILANLGHNAIHATPAGGEIRLGFSRTESHWVFEVVDQGPGIPTAQAAGLFQPRASTREGGSGIGLAICKQLAIHLGASLDLGANTPRGCTFILSLPTA